MITVRSYEVQFTVKEHPDTEKETVTVGESPIGGTDPELRAIVMAASGSEYTHDETLAVEEIENDN